MQPEGGGGRFRDALRSRDLRLLATATFIDGLGSWAYSTVLAVYVFERTGSPTWIAMIAAARWVPALLLASYGGVLADRYERTKVIAYSALLQALVTVAIAFTVATDASLALLVGLSALSAVMAAPYRPAAGALTPEVVPEKDLTAANGLFSTLESLVTVVGPGVGGALVALDRPVMAIGLNAASFVVAALIATMLSVRSRGEASEAGESAYAAFVDGVRALRSNHTATVLVLFCALDSAVYGAAVVLYVGISTQLGSGADGYGYLLVALGVGGVIAATFVNRLEALPRLSMVLAAGMIAYTAPTLLLVWVHTPAAAFGVEVIRGIATLVVDVLAMTALQRSLAPDLISRVFGVFWALIIAGLSLGAFVTPFLLNAFGLEATLWLDALVVPAVVVLVYPRLAALDRIAARTAEQVAPRVAVFEKLDIFSGAPRAALERLARSADEVLFAAGTTLLHEGDPADHLLVVVDGKVDVTAHGERGRGRKDKHIRFLTGPTYLGEIGLLQRIPRTATVTALEPSRVWRIDGQEFLDALSQTPMSARFVSGMTTRLRRTHPSQVVELPTQREPEAAPADADALP